MSGQIHRFKKERDYVNLDTHALRNQSLSWKAKGLHSYLLQLPDNWQINIADLANRSKDGRDGTAAGLTELIEAGYIIRQRVLNEKKQFEGWDYNVFEQPKQADDWKSENGKSVNGFAENGKSVTNNNETPTELSNELREEEEKEISSSSSEPENLSLEAERKKEIPPNSAQPPLDPPFTQVGTIEPAPPILARLYSPEHPDFSIVTSVPGTYTANTEFRRVNIPEEIEALKTDAAAKETFALVRKIPSNLYPDYVEAFEKEIGGTGETYHNLPAFRKHFFNWCGSRYEKSLRKATGAKATRSTIQTFRGTDYGNEKQAF